MLPSNPRAGRGPTPPTQPRSRSVGPSRQGPRHDSSTYDIGTHSRPSSPAGPPPTRGPSSGLPLPERPIRHARTNTSHNGRPRPNISSYRRSDDSYSSASSLLGRTRDQTGYTSPRTSIDDDDTSSKQLVDSRSRREDRSQTPWSYRSDEEEHSNSGSGKGTNGSALWDRVANVANSLSVNVGKAWAASINAEDGEDTPAGQESRLTRALKAYHLEKARDPTELPDWLFDERERGLRGTTWSHTLADEGTYARQDVNEVPGTRVDVPTGGLRAVYAQTTALGPFASNRQEVNHYRDDGSIPSRAADRLKAMREAKRGITNIKTPTPTNQTIERRDEGAGDDNRRVRIGLPSGPMSGRRR